MPSYKQTVQYKITADIRDAQRNLAVVDKGWDKLERKSKSVSAALGVRHAAIVRGFGGIGWGGSRPGATILPGRATASMWLTGGAQTRPGSQAAWAGALASKANRQSWGGAAAWARKMGGPRQIGIAGSPRGWSAMGRAIAFGKLQTGFRRVGDAAASASRKMQSFGGIATAYFGYRMVKNLSDVRKEFESLEKAYEFFYGGPARGFQELQATFKAAEESPYRSEAIAQNRRLLKAFRIDDPRALQAGLDWAAASQKPLEQIVMSFGRIASGVFGEGFEQLRRAGIATAELKKRGLQFDTRGAYKGDSQTALDVIFDYIEERAEGMAKALVNTWEGAMSNLATNWNRVKFEMTKTLFPLEKAQWWSGAFRGIAERKSRKNAAYDDLPADQALLKAQERIKELIGVRRNEEWVGKIAGPFKHLFGVPDAIRDINAEIQRLTDLVPELKTEVDIAEAAAKGDKSRGEVLKDLTSLKENRELWRTSREGMRSTMRSGRDAWKSAWSDEYITEAERERLSGLYQEYAGHRKQALLSSMHVRLHPMTRLGRLSRQIQQGRSAWMTSHEPGEAGVEWDPPTAGDTRMLFENPVQAQRGFTKMRNARMEADALTQKRYGRGVQDVVHIAQNYNFYTNSINPSSLSGGGAPATP